MEESRMSCLRNVGTGYSTKLAAVKTEKEEPKMSTEEFIKLQTEMKQFNGNTIWETIKK